jgi:uncharacterized protein (DUF305 family)
MKKTSILLTVSLALVSLVVGIGIGYYLTPEYSVTKYEKNMDLGAADRLVDLRYINAMIAHHRAAMLLAESAGASGREEIRALSGEILANEPKLIAELYGWKRDWYRDARTVSDPASINLGSVDGKFDLRFLNALIAHHEAGIAMTREIRRKSNRTEVLDNADAVEQFLAATLVGLKSWRNEWYGVQ